MIKFAKRLFTINFVIVTIVISLASISYGADDNIINGNYTELRANMTQDGIDLETQNKLISKLEKGEIWDSMSGKFNPLLLPKETYSSNETNYEKTVYPDGSYLITEINVSSNLNESLITPKSVTEGNLSWGGAGRWWNKTGNKASMKTGLVNCSFKFDASGSEATLAQIDRIYDYQIFVVSGTYNFEKFNIVRKVAYSNSPAYASLRFSYTSSALGHTITTASHNFQLYVASRTNMYTKLN